MSENIKKVSLQNYGQERDLICTEQERQIFDIVRELVDAPSPLRLVRVSDNYVSIVMDSTSGFGTLDVARIKFTNRAKWIKFAPEFKRVDISAPGDVVKLSENVQNAFDFNAKYL